MPSIFDFLFSSAATIALFGAVAVAQPRVTQPTFAVPALTGPVVDDARMLSQSTRERLSRFLRQLHDEGGTQIQILTVDNLGGLSIEEASIKVTDQWKLGTAKADNGILLMLSKQERRVRIEVGQGYEGDLPDVTASRIVREVIIPQFKEGDFDRGVTDGILAIVHYVNPQFLEGHNAAPRGTKISGLGFWLIVGWLLVFLVLPRMLGFRGRSPRGGWRGGWDDWGGGGWGGGGFGGGGWGGGSSGGGWSGGGGGFSGGGASGGW